MMTSVDTLTYPTLTQVPPSRGVPSTSPTLAPYEAALLCRRQLTKPNIHYLRVRSAHRRSYTPGTTTDDEVVTEPSASYYI